MTSKITPEAKARCAAHSLQEQLEQLKALHAFEIKRLEVRQKHDMTEIDQMIEGDAAWSGQHARLTKHHMPIGGVD